MASDSISGFVLLEMPSDNVKPLSLLSQTSKEVSTTGMTIKDLFPESDTALPLISPDYNISSKVDRSLMVEISVDSHLNLLQSLLKFLNLSASFNLQKSKSVMVNMIDAKKNIVNEFKLDSYINSGKLDTHSPSIVELLKNNKLFVVTEILKCKKYSIGYVVAKSIDSGTTAKMPNVADISARVHTGNNSSNDLTNEGDEYITLAVKAFRIYFQEDKNSTVSYRIRKDDSIKIIKGDEDFPGELLNAATVSITQSHGD